MGFQSKTYSLSDEVVAAIEAARARGETPNQLLRRVLLGAEPSPAIYIPPMALGNREGFVADLDATSPGVNPTAGKATSEVIRRSLREKGDGKR